MMKNKNFKRLYEYAETENLEAEPPNFHFRIKVQNEFPADAIVVTLTPTAILHNLLQNGS